MEKIDDFRINNAAFSKGRHFYSVNEYYREAFGEKVYRLAIDGHFTCPNRDGTKGVGGCCFCSADGSGDFTSHSLTGVSDITEQIEYAKALVHSKGAGKYIAYFQAFTGTYAPLDYLKDVYSSALRCTDIVALSIATRPDCINCELVELLRNLRKETCKPIYIELGVQTANDNIEAYLNRCYSFEDFTSAVTLLSEHDFPVIAHLILGLPTEGEDEIIYSLKKVTALPIHGIKLSLLHIIKGTVMHKLWQDKPELFKLTDKDEYIRVLARCIQNTPCDIVVYRITGDAPKSLLVAPEFTANKKDVLNSINRYLEINNIYQGELIPPPKCNGFESITNK